MKNFIANKMLPCALLSITLNWEVELHTLLALILDGGELLPSRPGYFTLPVSIRLKAGWSQEPLWNTEGKISCPRWEVNPTHLACSLVTVLIELYWLSFLIDAAPANASEVQKTCINKNISYVSNQKKLVLKLVDNHVL
jgi:hypothetical protein